MIALIIIFVLLGCLFAIAIPSDAEIEEEIREAKEWAACEILQGPREYYADERELKKDIPLPSSIGDILVWGNTVYAPSKKLDDWVPVYFTDECEFTDYVKSENVDEPHDPSCKCAYCDCTNDHIYGTCDYCGAPLEG